MFPSLPLSTTTTKHVATPYEWRKAKSACAKLRSRLKSAKPVQYQTFVKSYLRCIASIDDNVGRVLSYLDANGLTENTLVIYTSDQGVFVGEHGLFDKRFMYDDSMRMPFLVRYPAEIKAGTTNSDIVLNIDFAETLLDYGGARIPKTCKAAACARSSVAARRLIGASRCITAIGCMARTSIFRLIMASVQALQADLLLRPGLRQNGYDCSFHQARVGAVRSERGSARNEECLQRARVRGRCAGSYSGIEAAAHEYKDTDPCGAI